MRSKRVGFTLAELMVSLAILTLISATTVVSLKTTRQKDELTTAARLVASDIRNAQARAFTARNVLSCVVDGQKRRVCEPDTPSTTVCTGPCELTPPAHVGISFYSGQEFYHGFADVMNQDWRDEGTNERLFSRPLNPLGGRRVTISNLKTELGNLASTNLAVGRQNGTMRIEACGDANLPTCTPSEPKTLEITLRHGESGETVSIQVNAVTGRVSLQGL